MSNIKPNLTLKEHIKYLIDKLNYDISAGERGGKEHLPSIVLNGLKLDRDKYLQILEILSKK
tara:strand:- start:733 stop:918 length:186 start_codon:yes stop_codon:yes gene_type:complete